MPAWARDRANRLLLTRALDDPALPDDAARAARLLAARIRAEEAAGRTVQLHLLDLAGDRVALAFGDLDTADAVALLVPGVAHHAGGRPGCDGRGRARRGRGGARRPRPG